MPPKENTKVPLKPKQGERSVVWRSFELINERRDQVQCRGCNLKYEYSGSTTVMKKHASTCPQLGEDGFSLGDGRKKRPLIIDDTTSEPARKKLVNGPSHVQQFLQVTSTTPLPKATQLRLEKLMMEALVLSGSSFNQYQNKSFKSFISALNPRFDLPGRCRTRTILNETFRDASEKVKRYEIKHKLRSLMLYFRLKTA